MYVYMDGWMDGWVDVYVQQLEFGKNLLYQLDICVSVCAYACIHVCVCVGGYTTLEYLSAIKNKDILHSAGK